jgi:hypothetical protein
MAGVSSATGTAVPILAMARSHPERLPSLSSDL